MLGAVLVYSSLVEVLLQCVSLVVFLIGIVVVIRGKYLTFGHTLKAGKARFAGVCLLGPLVLGTAVDVLLYSSGLGDEPGDLMGSIIRNGLACGMYLLAIVAAVVIVRSLALKYGEQEAGPHHHVCLSGLLIIMPIFAAIALIDVFPFGEGAKTTTDMPAWVPIGFRVRGVLSLLMVATLIPIWRWQKWGVYVFTVLTLGVLGLNIIMFPMTIETVKALGDLAILILPVSLLGPIAGLIIPVLVLAFVSREWKYYD